MIKRRHVYHIAGYDPIDAPAQHRRFKRQLDIFRQTWKVDATPSDLAQAGDGARGWWSVTVRATDWQVEAVHEVLLWDDIVRGDFKRSSPVRLFRAAGTYLDFIASGTMFRYIAANLRYAMYFLFPLSQVTLLVAGAWLIAQLVTAAFDLTGIGAAAVGLPLGLVAFAVLLQWPGRRWGLHQLLDDWICARDYLYGQRPDIESRLDLFADALVARARLAGIDEIVIVGHSLGAMLALDVIVRALDRDPDLGRHGATICLLTVGATIPKFSLHPSADRIRRAITRIATEPSIAWAEFQARDDTISFYKFDPVSLRRIAGDRIDGKPVIRRVQIHDMLQSETFARYRNNFFRLHYQWVMANDRPATYDFFMMICGPVRFLRWTTSPEGFMNLIAPDGSYRDSSGPGAIVTEPAS